MSNPQTRSVTIVAAVALMLPLVFGGQAFAAKNDHRYAQSLEGIRAAHENYCDRLKETLRLYEDLASDLAGTAEGDENSALADQIFAKAEDAGCKWAR